MRVCSIPDCAIKHYARNYCKKHYKTMTEPGRKSEMLCKERYKSKNRQKLRDYSRRYKKTPKGRKAQREHLERRAQRMIEATPPWSSFEEMKWLYEFAHAMGLVIDHCVPLLNPIVCGLNCPDNIRFVTKEENLKKGNKFTEENI